MTKSAMNKQWGLFKKWGNCFIHGHDSTGYFSFRNGTYERVCFHCEKYWPVDRIEKEWPDMPTHVDRYVERAMIEYENDRRGGQQ